MDELSLACHAQSFARSFAKGFAPWSKIPPEEWCEEVYRLPGGKRFRWTYAPYARAMFRSLFERRTRETVFQLYSRGLKSTVILMATGYFIDQAPRKMLFMWPTTGQAEKFSKDSLDGELFATVPSLNYLSSQSGRRLASQTILHKAFPGGSLTAFGANAPGELRRAKGSFLAADECDAYENTITDEGDIMAIFERRGAEYPDTVRVSASYPSVKGRSRIESKMLLSDGNEWHSTCVRCGGEPFVMHRRQLIYEPGKPETARLKCPRCGELLTDAERYQMAHQQGFDCWRPARDFAGTRGFHASAMLWPHPVDLEKYPGGFLQTLAQQEIDAKLSENPARSLRVLVNTVDADPFDPLEENEKPPEWRPLYDRREDYGTEKGLVVPAGALVLTAAIDVHKNRLEIEWEGLGRQEEVWGLSHVVLPGEVQDDAVWKELERELLREFAHELGCPIGLSFAFVDAGKWPDWVFKFLARIAREGSGIHGKIRACRGTPTFPHPIIDRRYASIAKNLKGHWVGGDAAKDLIYTRLRKPEKDGPGWRHFPMTYEPVHFEQLVSEKPTIQFVGGEELRRYKNEDHVRNEMLDLAVYNLAAQRLRPWNFDAIENDLREQAEMLKGEIVKPEPPKSRIRRTEGFL